MNVDTSLLSSYIFQNNIPNIEIELHREFIKRERKVKALQFSIENKNTIITNVQA